MLLFGIGLIAGLLINPFRKETVKTLISVKKIPERVSFIEPKDDLTSVISLKDYIHD